MTAHGCDSHPSSAGRVCSPETVPPAPLNADAEAERENQGSQGLKLEVFVFPIQVDKKDGDMIARAYVINDGPSHVLIRRMPQFLSYRLHPTNSFGDGVPVFGADSERFGEEYFSVDEEYVLLHKPLSPDSPVPRNKVGFSYKFTSAPHEPFLFDNHTAVFTLKGQRLVCTGGASNLRCVPFILTCEVDLRANRDRGQRLDSE